MKLPSPTIAITSILLANLPLPGVHASFFDTLKLKLASPLPLPPFLRNKIATPADHSALLSLHKALVEIPSITGSEFTVAEWLADYLISKNFTVETQLVSTADDGGEDGVKKRENVFAYLGKTRDTHALVTSHIDVVPPYIPYRETASAVYGRGSCDAKGSVAAQIIAVEELVKQGQIHEGDVSMLFVVGEEVDGEGMKMANALNPGWKTIIFGEPTELKLAVGHKGIAEFEIISEGKAAHSGYPQLGINANSNLIKVLYELDRLELPSSALLGNSTLNIGQIEGGVAANVVPSRAQAVGSVRIAGQLEETVKRINEVVEGVEGVRIVWFDTPHYGPVELDYDVEGFQTTICSYGTDVPYLKGNHKKYLYGPGSILVAHGDTEHVLKSDLFEAVKGYKKLIRESMSSIRLSPAIVKDVKAKVTVAVGEAELEVVSSSAMLLETIQSEGIKEGKENEKEEGKGESKEERANEEL